MKVKPEDVNEQPVEAVDVVDARAVDVVKMKVYNVDFRVHRAEGFELLTPILEGIAGKGQLELSMLPEVEKSRSGSVSYQMGLSALNAFNMDMMRFIPVEKARGRGTVMLKDGVVEDKFQTKLPKETADGEYSVSFSNGWLSVSGRIRMQSKELRLEIDASGLVDAEWDEPVKPEPGPGPVPDDHIVRQIGVWYGGENLSGAVLDPEFRLEVRNNGRDWSPAPASWPAGRAGAGCPSDCNVMVCAAYKRSDGVWVGGKYDWNRVNPSPRGWANIRNGYKGWIAPPDGTEMVCWCYTAHGNRVSTMATTVFR